MFRGLLDTVKTGYNTVAAYGESAHEFLYGSIEGKLTKYEISFLNCARELCKKNNGTLPSGSAVLFAFMEKYLARSQRVTTDMSHSAIANKCKATLMNRGDEVLPEAMKHIQSAPTIEEVGYFAALLNVFFYLYPQHDPGNLENLKNKDGKRKVLAPAKFQLNSYYEQFTNDQTFPHVTGYQLERLAQVISPQYVDAFAACLMQRLTRNMEFRHDLETYMYFSSFLSALGILHQRSKSRPTKEKIKQYLEAQADVNTNDLHLVIVGAADGLMCVNERATKTMATALMTYVTNNISQIISIPDSAARAYPDDKKLEQLLFLRKLFKVLKQHESMFDSAQMQTIMFHLMQQAVANKFIFEINQLRHWMSGEQLQQFRVTMKTKKDNNDELWFVCRTWLQDESFLIPKKGYGYYMQVKQPHHDPALIKMLTPTQQELSIETYKMSFSSRLIVLMRDLAGEESIEKCNGKNIPMTVISSLRSTLTRLCSDLRMKDKVHFQTEFESEAVIALSKTYFDLMDAIPLLKDAEQFSKEERVAFAKQILDTLFHVEENEQFKTMYAALSICPELLNDSKLKASCEKVLLYYASNNLSGKCGQEMFEACKIFAKTIPYTDLMPFMLAISTSNSTLSLHMLQVFNKVFEKRCHSPRLRQPVANPGNIPDNTLKLSNGN